MFEYIHFCLPSSSGSYQSSKFFLTCIYSLTLHFLNYIYSFLRFYLLERERERAWVRGGAEGEGEVESPLSRFTGVGLDPLTLIVTWAQVKCFNQMSHQAHLMYLKAVCFFSLRWIVDALCLFYFVVGLF